MEEHRNLGGGDTMKFKTLASLAAASTAAVCAACAQGDQDHAKQMAGDAFIVAEVRAKAAAIDAASMSLVSVTFDKGTVTLSGTISKASERSSIEAAAAGVNGVKTVVDKIVVDPSAPTGAEIEADLALGAQVRAALAEQTGVNAARIHVDVHRAVVTLSGTLPSLAHREVADETVRSIRGVKKLIDKIEVEGK
jgi:hyperosmotically inducible protein